MVKENDMLMMLDKQPVNVNSWKGVLEDGSCTLQATLARYRAT